jgi:hypothetical protein
MAGKADSTANNRERLHDIRIPTFLLIDSDECWGLCRSRDTWKAKELPSTVSVPLCNVGRRHKVPRQRETKEEAREDRGWALRLRHGEGGSVGFLKWPGEQAPGDRTA